MRVIAGKLKSRQLKSVDSKLTRPTTDKNKENLFNMIGPYFQGGTCLDLFAGSGGLGIEAISRGMDQLYSVDKQYRAFLTVKDNVKALMDLGVGGSDAVAMDTVVARYYMAKDPGKYSIIKDTTILDEKMGVGFRKGDNALCKKVEDTLKEMQKDGTLAKISKKWFGEDLTIIGEDK